MSKIFEKDPVEQFSIVPNSLFDDLMPALAPAAFKIVILIYRKTKGWHKDVDDISFSQIMEGTGIKSSATIAKHLNTLSEMGVILRMKGDGAWDINSYALNPNFDTAALKNEVGYHEHTLKNEARSALKNEARNSPLALKNEDTKNNPKKQRNIFTQNFSKTNGNGSLRHLKIEQLADVIADKTKTDDPAFVKKTVILALKVCEVCKLDLVTIVDYNTLESLYGVSIALVGKEIKPADLDGFAVWWYDNTWQGQRGQPPTPKLIGDHWGQFEARNTAQNMTMNGYNPQLTPEQIEALRQFQMDDSPIK